jgi:hypothetical protein
MSLPLALALAYTAVGAYCYRVTRRVHYGHPLDPSYLALCALWPFVLIVALIVSLSED